MERSYPGLMGLVRETLSDPRAGARRIMSINLDMAERWQALALVVILSVLLGRAVAWLMLGGEAAMGGAIASPLQSGLIQGGALLMVVFAAYQVGRLMGGHGSLADSVILVSWLQAIMLLVQLVQVVALLVLPPFTGILSVLGMVLFLWLLTNFVAEMHGFDSLGKVFGMIIITALGLGFIASIVLGFMGVAPPEIG